VLDPRSGPRQAWLFDGALLARGRRTVTKRVSIFGLRLREFRKKRWLTLVGFAEVVGIKHQQLSRIELGATQPTWADRVASCRSSPRED
jgi:DNA-binding XRE family transcriptional regulator